MGDAVDVEIEDCRTRRIRARLPLPLREREGPIAKRWEGEGRGGIRVDAGQFSSATSLTVIACVRRGGASGRDTSPQGARRGFAGAVTKATLLQRNFRRRAPPCLNSPDPLAHLEPAHAGEAPRCRHRPRLVRPLLAEVNFWAPWASELCLFLTNSLIDVLSPQKRTT
jgi:hypothetical protein